MKKERQMKMENEKANNGELSVQIYTDFKTALPEKIKWNYENLHKSIEDALAPLHGLVIEKNAEGIKFAKGKRAAINKMMNLILDARVETKKQYLAPFEDFEKKANALILMCRTASGEFDSFVKECESEIKEAKKRRIHEYLIGKVASVFGNCADCCNSPFWSVYECSNSRWLNATYKESEIHSEIDAKTEECKKTYDSIQAFFGDDAENREKALIEVVKDFDLNRVVAIVNSYREEQRRIREAAERSAALKAAEAERALNMHVEMERAKVELEAKRKAEEASANKEVAKEEPIYTFNLKLSGKRESLTEMLREIVENGIGVDGCQMKLTAKLSSLRKFRSWIDANGIKYETV